MTSRTFEERLDGIVKEKAEWSNLAMTSTEDWITNYSVDQVRALIDQVHFEEDFDESSIAVQFLGFEAAKVTGSSQRPQGTARRRRSDVMHRSGS